MLAVNSRFFKGKGKFKGGNNPPGGSAGQRTDSTSSSTKRPGSCNWCGTPGHWARECWKKKAGEPQQQPRANAAVKEKNSGETKAPVKILTACLSSSRNDDGSWYLDSGATTHICKDRELFTTLNLGHVNDKVLLGDEQSTTSLRIDGRGTCIFRLQDGTDLRLDDVLYVPSMAKNLMSMSQLM